MKSFKYALAGIGATLKNQRNMRIHVCFAIYVVLAGFVTGLDMSEWAAVLLCIGFVCALECLNTALESLCDAVHPQKSSGIGRAKDAAAGGVLCMAVVSAIIGGLVFFREDKIASALEFLINQKILSGLIILSLIPAMMFVVGRKRETK